MQNSSKDVSSDPCNVSKEGASEACGENNGKRPTTIVILNDKDLLKRTKIDTSPLSNPFNRRTAGKIRLFTNFRSATIGWPVILRCTQAQEKVCVCIKGVENHVQPLTPIDICMLHL